MDALMKRLNNHFITLLKAMAYPEHHIHKKSAAISTFHPWNYDLTGFQINAKNISLRSSTIATYINGKPIEIPKDEREDRKDCHGIVRDAGILFEEGRSNETLDDFYLMDRQGIYPNFKTYACLLEGCADRKALGEAKRLHGHMIKYGFKPGTFLGNRLVDVYVKCGSMDYARQVFDNMSLQDVVSWTTIIAGYMKCGCIGYAHQMFDKMPERNIVSWNAMIAGYAQHGYVEEAVRMFRQMQKAGMTPNSVTFTGILSASASLAGLEQGKQVHAHILKFGLELNVFVASALLDMYSKCRCVVDARQVFDRMPERNVVSWNTMIDGHGKYGSIEDARYLFDKMPKRSVVSWTSMIAGYAQHGCAEEAFNLFRQMQQVSMRSDQFTYACVLSLCASVAVLEHGKQIHGHSIRIGFDSYVSVANGLVTMYAKCGSIENARRVFEKMPEHNVVSWTAMISGCAMHGYGEDALQLFEQMLWAGVKPDRITFLGVLSACSHAGLVDGGCYYFDSMSRKHGILPRTNHYACMIDLLGRAGHLDVAEELINEMPFEPDSRVWSALLGACRINGNVDLGQRAAECLFELEPQSSATYVLLSNIYAAAGRWDDVANVRKVMKERGVKKIPGWSWIEVNKKVHTFVVADKSHPQTEQIYASLEGLTREIQEAGYVPDTKYVLNDVG